MRKTMMAALLSGAAMTAMPAHAAQATPAGASDASGGEIIVTARRKSENLENVPAAITAFNAQALAERQIRSDADLQTVTPGLTIRQTQGNNSLSYSIRGQTSDTFSGSSSAVIAYLNEVPLTVGSAASFYDLENVQVLKGPQGTLFGRNTTGGAVLFNTAKPTDRLEARLTGRVGNLALREVEGMVNVPLVEDKVLFRAAFDVTRRGGYIWNTFPGHQEWLGQIERNSGRASLTLKPVDGFTNTTVFQYNGADGTNTGASYTWSVYRCGETNNGIALNCATAAVYGAAAANYPATQKALGLYQTNHPGGARNHGHDWELSNTSTLDLGPDLTLKNIFGASQSKYNSVQPQLGAPFVTIATYNAATGQVGNELDIKSVSDEVQLAGKALGGNLSYIVGAWFQWQTTDTIWPQSYFLATPFPPLQPDCASCLTSAFRVHDASQAVYGQATYDLGSMVQGLKFTAGVRYSWDKLAFSQIAVPGNFFSASPAQKHTYSDPSWEVGLEYQPSLELLTYIKTRGSFRAGGFNGARIPPSPGLATAGGDEFTSEHTQDIEGGVKFHGELGGRPFTLNADAFYQWVQDVQRVEFPQGGAITVNVPSEIVRGVEGDVNFKPTDWLELGGQATYVSAKYPNGVVPLPILSTTLFYGPVADTPKFSGTLYAQLTLPTPETVGTISLRTEVYGQTGQYFSNEAASTLPDTRLPGYALLNMRLSWSNIMKSGLSAAIFGKNVGNRGYFVGGMPLGGVLGHNAADVGEPRTFGAELTYKF